MWAVCLYGRDPEITTNRNDQMGQHRIESSQKKHTHTEPVSAHMVSIFQCSDRFTPLPLCLLSYYHCLSEEIGRLWHMPVEPVPFK